MNIFKYLGQIFNDFQYILECRKTDRKDRLPVCRFWKSEKKSDSQIYREFIDDYYKREHKEWCIFYSNVYRSNDYCSSKEARNIREDVRYLGVSLHAECHGPLELTQKRIIGAKSLPDSDDKGITEEIFRRHYHEVGCLKAVLISEINLKEQEKSTQMNIGVFFASIFFSVLIAKSMRHFQFSAGIAQLFNDGLSSIIYFVLGISIFMFLFVLYRYFQCCTNLNIAKDTLYICLGGDVNRRKEIGKKIIDQAGESKA